MGIDTRRIVLAGHSMGGWVTAETASHDKGLIGAVLISTGDIGRAGGLPMEQLEALAADNMESLAGVTAKSLAEELKLNANKFRLENVAAGLVDVPLLALTSDDGLASDTNALVSAVEAKGGHKVSVRHVATDHSWSDHRIALERAL